MLKIPLYHFFYDLVFWNKKLNSKYKMLTVTKTGTCKKKKPQLFVFLSYVQYWLITSISVISFISVVLLLFVFGLRWVRIAQTGSSWSAGCLMWQKEPHWKNLPVTLSDWSGTKGLWDT